MFREMREEGVGPTDLDSLEQSKVKFMWVGRLSIKIFVSCCGDIKNPCRASPLSENNLLLGTLSCASLSEAFSEWIVVNLQLGYLEQILFTVTVILSFLSPPTQGYNRNK